MAEFSIAIPVYNGWSYLHQLLMDIKRHGAGVVDEVVIVDDASPDGDITNGLNFWKGLNVLPMRVIQNKENCGFTITANRALIVATGKIKLCLSTDVRIYSHTFFSEIKAILTEHPHSLVGPQLYTRDTGWNKFGDDIYPYIEGWAVAATADTWEDLGYFDERYAPSDFEDVDLSTQAISMGYTLQKMLAGNCEHLGGKSYGYGLERERRTILNRSKFEKKWRGS